MSYGWPKHLENGGRTDKAWENGQNGWKRVSALRLKYTNTWKNGGRTDKAWENGQDGGKTVTGPRLCENGVRTAETGENGGRAAETLENGGRTAETCENSGRTAETGENGQNMTRAPRSRRLWWNSAEAPGKRWLHGRDDVKTVAERPKQRKTAKTGGNGET